MNQMVPATKITRANQSVGSQLIRRAEEIRLAVNAGIDPTRRGPLGQFTTPPQVAGFMSSIFTCAYKHVRLLDPGAGTGALTSAFVAGQISRKKRPRTIMVTAYEVDAHMATGLMDTLQACEKACTEIGVSFAYDLRKTDYIRDRADRNKALWSIDSDQYDAVIMNPPYHKINSGSLERKLLRDMGIEVSNLYAAFMLLAARQLVHGGEFVSITPRSFCNGPYFRRFRREFFELIAVDRIHVYESRSETFRADDVLQENIIIHGTRDCLHESEVTISKTVAGGGFEERAVCFDQIVRQDDPEQVIHVIADDRGDVVSERMLALRGTLDELGFTASTGRVVDFRAREHLREEASDDTVPLIFPAHMKEGRVVWPNGQTRKPNAIVANSFTDDLLVDSGFYVLIKRFSAKEERRRIVAALYDPRAISTCRVGFDNKTNYIHTSGNGLPKDEAVGLTIYLNSSLVDEYFRLFSGHTQVNAADLKRLPYPTRKQLLTLARNCKSLSDQQLVDQAVDSLI
ncbi:SAM-dependent methyltransferase [Planctomycetales bacterium ZRK34]|nr:SAM-dependent methyltransferase [Planctomycetales bacterium ZRK34]